MSSKVKEIKVKVIPSKVANTFIKMHHYSGKIVNNSSLHFGAFLEGKLHGVMSYGSPLDKRKVLPMVKNTAWNEMLELNRMAFDKHLPRNSESRCISISIKLLKKHAPQIKWILSFADATQCGDGTIYRASGFKLVKIKNNSDCMITDSGEIIHTMTVKSSKRLMSKYGNWKDAMRGEYGDFKPLSGYQIKYIYLIDKTCELNFEPLDYSEIDKVGAGMYKGKKIERGGRNQTAFSQLGADCASITPPAQLTLNHKKGSVNAR
jgi:hypothetical protein